MSLIPPTLVGSAPSFDSMLRRAKSHRSLQISVLGYQAVAAATTSQPSSLGNWTKFDKIRAYIDELQRCVDIEGISVDADFIAKE